MSHYFVGVWPRLRRKRRAPFIMGWWENIGRCIDYEDDVSAEEEISRESAWLPRENGYERREKSFGCQTCEGKKSPYGRLIPFGFPCLIWEKSGESARRERKTGSCCAFSCNREETEVFSREEGAACGILTHWKKQRSFPVSTGIITPWRIAS